MKLILHRLIDNHNYEPHSQHYMPSYYRELFKMWLFSNGLFPDESFELSYNGFYHFYELSLFQARGYGRNSYIQAIIDFLIKEGYKIDVYQTYKCNYTYDNNDKRIAYKINGTRILIYVKQFSDICSDPT